MVFERIEANKLSDLTIKIDEYLQQWNPKLFDTEVAEPKWDKQKGEWITTIIRQGELLHEAKRII